MTLNQPLSIASRVGILFLILGGLCLTAFRLIGSSIDAEGMLHEPFALLPVGWLFIVAGAGVIVTRAIARVVKR